MSRRLPPISSLIMSPPEGDPLDSFHAEDKSRNSWPQGPHGSNPFQYALHRNGPAALPTAVVGDETTVATTVTTPTKTKDEQPRQALSPPESPAALSTKRQDSTRALPHSGLSKEIDPVLYPRSVSQDHGSSANFDEPALFPSSHDSITAAIRRHIDGVAVHYMKGKSKGDKRTLRYQMPSEEEYRLTVSFVSSLGKDTQPSLKRVREEDLQNYPAAKRLGVQQPIRSPDSLSKATPQKASTQAATPRTATRTSPKQTSTVAKKPTTPRVRAIPRAAPGEGGRNASSGSGHTRVREPKKPIDTNWRSLPDYAPSMQLLEENPKALRVDWDGNPLNLGDDPDRDFMHEAELNLASALRLSGARYLTCKRRIFMARVNALKIGKEFKKTDAQQACQIDVNKASKLWTAYDKAGWLQPQLFKQYL